MKARFLLKREYFTRGFTIVELLVVIVVIGILASLTAVSYSGITQKAYDARIIAELSNASKKLNLYKAENGSYPTALDANKCPTAPVADTSNYCIKSSSGINYTYVSDGAFFNLFANYGTSSTYYDVTESSMPAQISGGPNGWNQISSGTYVNCSISYIDNAYCWGHGFWGQMGNGTVGATGDTLTPTPITRNGALNGLRVLSIAVSYMHTCVIASDHNAYCWGQYAAGQLGNNTTDGTGTDSPTAVDRTNALSGLTLKQISAGNNFTCALASNDNVYCWGANGYGQIGDGTSGTNRITPTAVDRTGVLSGVSIKQISVGYYYSCALATNDNIYCWGSNAYGQMGNGTSGGNQLVPVLVDKTGVLNGLSIKQIAAGFYHVCVIASDGNPYCWGRDSYGEIGDGTSGTNRLVPTAVDKTGVLNGLSVEQISAGYNYTCSIASNKKAYCWGSNTNGQIGDGTSGTNSLVPAAVNTSGALSGLTMRQITTSTYFSCAVASDNNDYCWGKNNYGQIGDNTSGTDRLMPTRVINPF